MKQKKRIGELLVEHGAITQDELQEALDAQADHGGRVCEVLIHLGYLTEEALLECLGSQMGIVSVNVRQYTIDPELRQYVPESFAVQHELMPLDKLGKNLTVAMAVPLDVETRTALEEQTGLRVRAVLCSRSDVHAVIEQYYGVLIDEEDASDDGTPEEAPAPAVLAPGSPPDADALEPGPEAVRLKGVTALLETVDQFPLLPEVHSRILEQIQEPEANVAELTELISQDPTLAANILKLANSAAYAARSEFDSVKRAIAYIGLRELHGIVVGTAVMETLDARTSFDLSRLFLQAFHCGLLTKIIADRARLGDRDAAFTAGLLHNIGTIVIRVYSPECLERIEETVKETGLPLPQVQDRLLGLTGTEVGFQLTERWNIPASLGAAIRFYDRLDSTTDVPPLAYAIALALCCMEHDNHEEGFGDPAEDEQLAKLLTHLDLSPADLTPIEHRYRDGMDTLTRLDATLS